MKSKPLPFYEKINKNNNITFWHTMCKLIALNR